MGQSVLKAAVLFTLFMVCANSQLEFQGNDWSDERDQQTEAVEERDNFFERDQVIIDLPDCSGGPNTSCNCTKIQELMSAELQETNRQLQQLQTAVSDIAELLSKFTVSPTTQPAPPMTIIPVSPTTQPAPPMTTIPVILEEDCSGVLARGSSKSGVYTVKPPGDGMPVQVYCDMETDGGGWTVFQRRQDGSVDFYRNFNIYSQGFGDLEGEFWLGNDILHQFTANGDYKLRVDLGDFQGNSAFEVYKTFRIGDRDDNYRLDVASYSGSAGDSLISVHKNQPFTTWDRDLDNANGANCAVAYHGAWWYNLCYYAHLNGEYLQGHQTKSRGIIWKSWRGFYEPLKSSEMKIRKKN